MMDGEVGWVVLGWLRGFLAFNVLLAVVRSVRTRHDRRMLRRLWNADLDLFLRPGGSAATTAAPFR